MKTLLEAVKKNDVEEINESVLQENSDHADVAYELE